VNPVSRIAEYVWPPGARTTHRDNGSVSVRVDAEH